MAETNSKIVGNSTLTLFLFQITFISTRAEKIMIFRSLQLIILFPNEIIPRGLVTSGYTDYL